MPPWFLDDIRLSLNPDEIVRYNRRSLEWLSGRGSIENPDGDDPWIGTNVLRARQAYSDPDTWSVLLTARGKNAEPVLRAVLDENNIQFDEYVFKREMVDPETGQTRYLEAPEFKRMIVEGILSRPDMAGVESVEVFEDSQENIDAISSIVSNEVSFIPHLELTRRVHRQTRKSEHKKLATARAKERKEFYAKQQSSSGSPLSEWRTAGQNPLPGDYNKGAPQKKKTPRDATYGSEPDLLDKPGVIVEPDVRKKISNYFTKMKLREIIREILRISE